MPKLKIEDMTDDQLLWVLSNKCWLEDSWIVEEIRSFIRQQFYPYAKEIEVPHQQFFLTEVQ
jgi:hypothetical protein